MKYRRQFLLHLVITHTSRPLLKAHKLCSRGGGVHPLSPAPHPPTLLLLGWTSTLKLDVVHGTVCLVTKHGVCLIDANIALVDLKGSFVIFPLV